VIDPVAFHVLLMALTGWLDRRERQAIAYLIEENRLLRRQVGGRRLRLTDDDLTPAGRASAPGRTCGFTGDCHNRDARHLAPMASPVDCPQVDVRREIRLA
jgi:hypothetical protein